MSEEGPIDYAIANGERLIGVLESAMDPGAVAAARDTIHVARRDLATIRSRITALEGLLRECRDCIRNPGDWYDGGDGRPFDLCSRLDAALTPDRKD